jgi:hypothetical protein
MNVGETADEVSSKEEKQAVQGKDHKLWLTGLVVAGQGWGRT